MLLVVVRVQRKRSYITTRRQVTLRHYDLVPTSFRHTNTHCLYFSYEPNIHNLSYSENGSLNKKHLVLEVYELGLVV